MADLPLGGNSAEQLRGFVERIERLEEERKGIGDDIRDVVAEAKANGFDTKQLRAVVRERRKEANKRMEERAIFDTYAEALGIIY